MMNNQRFYKEIEAHFNLRTNKTKKPEMVYLVVRIDGKQYKLSSGVKVYPSQWHKGIAEESNLLCKRDNNNNKIVNEKLTVLKKRYSEFISYLCNCDTEITDMGGLLKQFIYKDMINKKEKNAVEYINEAFENYYKSRNATVQTKNDCKRKIENYFIPYVKEQKDQSINILRQEGFSKWAKWLTDKTSPIVINDTLQLIVRLIKQITIDYPKLELTKPIYNKVQVEKNTQKKNEGKPLTKAEIEAIEKFEPKNDTQKATKILFLIGVETGARSCDWNKFIEGDYEQKGNNKVLIIHPQKTERKEGNDAYVTLTPKLEQLIKEAREMDIIYVDRGKNDKLEDKGRSHKTRVIMTTFVYNLRKICETINKNTSGELFSRQKLVVGGETKPAYQAISSHWARHTFVHKCKLKGMSNDTIAKKIGDSVAMVEQNYGFMDKEEIAELVLKAEEEAKKEGKLVEVSNDAPKKTTLINAFFAYDDIVSLMDMKESGISIYDDARLKKAISIIKKSVTKDAIDKATRLFKDADKDTVIQFKKNVDSINSFIWNIGKLFADTKLYMMYQYKQNKLGLLEGKLYTENELDDIWQAEIHMEERVYRQ